MDDFTIPLAFPLSAGDRAHLAAAAREPAHRAALHRRIEDQQLSTRALLTPQATPGPRVLLVPRPRAAQPPRV